ncbi:MAG TPA: glycosyltransferase [Solirubrobacteraceae bacterium]|jgi:UDP:flavonoid glycosyltransferase YjiC (YdhE family)
MSVVFVAMQGISHLKRMRPLIAGVTRRGETAHVFAEPPLRAIAEEAGGVFHDVFENRPQEQESQPRPVRNVTFAGEHAESLAAELKVLGARLVVYDTFAPVGRAVGHALGLPYVNVCAGHAVDPSQPQRFMSLADGHRPLIVSDRCRRAVDVLRERYGFDDASPLSYMTSFSPHLNVYCEPPAFLDATIRPRFEPVAFLGSLSPDAERDGGDALFGGAELRVYASLGTIAWRYFSDAMLAALEAVAAAVESRADAQAIISLGNSGADPASLRRPRVTVRPWVDQWAALRDADVFVTHHGLNSTHEAIWHRIPMLGYPLFGDQPGQAADCARMGLSIALGEGTRAPLTEDDVHAALDALEGERVEMHGALERARAEEARVIAGRDELVDRLLKLAG